MNLGNVNKAGKSGLPLSGAFGRLAARYGSVLARRWQLKCSLSNCVLTFTESISATASPNMSMRSRSISAKSFASRRKGAAILLFDEADALFGIRTNVKDSHDRYANIDVSHLLERMGAVPDLTILATNQKNAPDQTFLLRIRLVVDRPTVACRPVGTERS